jgi:hypothetical protein
MKASSITLLSLLLTANVFCLAEEVETPAKSLVQAAKFDFAVLDALAYSNGRVLFPREQYDKISGCISTHGPDLVTPLLADEVSNVLTQNEIRVALDYYESPLGRKFTDASILLAHQKHQIDMEKTIPEFSEQEKRTVAEFVASPIAGKLVGVFSGKNVLEAIKQKMLQTCASH